MSFRYEAEVNYEAHSLTSVDKVELAAHERDRKRQQLKDAPTRGHNKQDGRQRNPTFPSSNALTSSQTKASRMITAFSTVNPTLLNISMRTATTTTHGASAGAKKTASSARRPWAAQLARAPAGLPRHSLVRGPSGAPAPIARGAEAGRATRHAFVYLSHATVPGSTIRRTCKSSKVLLLLPVE